MAKITFSDVNQAGDIPTFDISKEKLLGKYTTIVSDMLYTREGKIVVCFQSWKDADYQNQHQDILVSKNDIQIEDFLITAVEDIEDKLIDFNFFCFDTYEDSFKYCIDLKEGL